MKKITIFLLTLSLILINITNVYATETTNSFNIEIQTDKDIKGKEQAIIYICLSDYAGDGILGYEGKIDYDKNVFESLTITELNNWDKVNYDETTGKFLSTTQKATSNTKIAQITLKLKKDVTAKETTVTINDLQISDGDETKTVSKSLTYNINESDSQTPTMGETKDPTPDKSNTPQTPTTEDKQDEKQETPKQFTVEPVNKEETDNTKAKTNIPQTGTKETAIIIASIVLTLGIVGYIKYRLIPLK